MAIRVGSLFAFSVLSVGLSFPALANDASVASIKVDEIRMREYGVQNGREVELRRLTNPNFRITFSGAEARKLQSILPSYKNAISATPQHTDNPQDFLDSFRALVVYSDPSVSERTGVTTKGLQIECNDGEMVQQPNGRMRVQKLDKTSCTISIRQIAEPYELGDLTDYEPVCRE